MASILAVPAVSGRAALDPAVAAGGAKAFRIYPNCSTWKNQSIFR